MFFQPGMAITPELLKLLAHVPTHSLPKLAHPNFWFDLSDAHIMRIAVELAQKSYEEGGCPIGGVIVDNESRRILGKGHNTLVQENHPYNHGETSAMRDAGSIDFSRTTMFTTLTPCNVCACLIEERGFRRLVIGYSPDRPQVLDASGTRQASNNEDRLRSRKIKVELLDDPKGIELYDRFREEKPDLDVIDWRGVAGLKDQDA